MLHTLKTKLRGRRGETIAEVLIAMLIILLAVLLLAATVSAAGTVNAAAKAEDERFYGELSAAEVFTVYPGASFAAGDTKIVLRAEKLDGADWVQMGTEQQTTVKLAGGNHIISYTTAP